ncbi:Qat anti-phage system TatD family nuclease QatD [Aeromicrobium sp. CFBP 8757]|uniref:Qat anti-phage system TatD family nuclease QatD n=1 Tax=Aeromicrobium sp. CFBP 8757 TaxID=2775288 RepID=UPI0018D8B15E
MTIDFHSHLDLYPDAAATAAKLDASVGFVLSVTTTPKAWNGTQALERHHPAIHTALGLHPQLAQQRQHEVDLFEELVSNARFIGEVGLDGTDADETGRRAQTDVLSRILTACARDGGKVVSLHSRRATSKVLDLWEGNPGAGTPVLHWFSGSRAELQRAVNLGCWFSVGPAMLRGAKGRQVVAAIPRDRILTETDGPFAQSSQRGLMPAQTEEAVAVLAQVWRTDAMGVDQLLETNLASLLQQNDITL